MRVQPPETAADPEGIETLESELGPELYQQLLVAFLEDLDLKLARLRQAAAAGDVPAARGVAHQIKGSALSFGAVRLDSLAADLLRIGPGQGNLVGPLVDEVANQVARLNADKDRLGPT